MYKVGGVEIFMLGMYFICLDYLQKATQEMSYSDGPRGRELGLRGAGPVERTEHLLSTPLTSSELCVHCLCKFPKIIKERRKVHELWHLCRHILCFHWTEHCFAVTRAERGSGRGDWNPALERRSVGLMHQSYKWIMDSPSGKGSVSCNPNLPDTHILTLTFSSDTSI